MVYYRDMASLILTLLFGLIIAYFAAQNTGVITLNFLTYTIPGVPTHVVVVGALLVGLFLSWIMSLVNSIGTGFTIRGKESTIKDYKKENAELIRKIHQLELENTRLKAETDEPLDDKSL